MPWLVWSAIGLGGAWIGSLSTTAASSPSPIYQTPQEASNDFANYGKAALYAAGAVAIVIVARKLIK